MSTTEEAREKLRARMAQVQFKKGQPRKAAITISKAAHVVDHSDKVRTIITKTVGAQYLPQSGEIIFHRNGAPAMVFNHPKCLVAHNAKTTFITGNYSEKNVEPSAQERQLMEFLDRFNAMQATTQAAPAADDDAVPTLVEDFEKESDQPRPDQPKADQPKADNPAADTLQKHDDLD